MSVSNAFALNKIYTTLALIVIYGGAFLWLGSDPMVFWPAMLFIYMVTGYGHFLLGFGYQAKSLYKKTQQPGRNLAKIWGLSALLAIPFFWTLQFTQWGLYMMMFVVVYFLWHGALNEKTLFERESGKKADPLFYLIGAILFWWSVDSFQHPSVFFSADYQFDPNVTTLMIENLSQRLHLTEIWWGSAGLMGLLALYFAMKALVKKQLLNLICVIVLILIAVGSWWVFEPMSFIVLLSLILSYHFIMWWIYYAQVFLQKTDKTTWRYYLLWSVLVHGIAILLIGVGYYDWFDLQILESLYQSIFLIPVFLTTTFLHITTSFFNEEPVKRWLNLN